MKMCTVKEFVYYLTDIVFGDKSNIVEHHIPVDDPKFCQFSPGDDLTKFWIDENTGERDTVNGYGYLLNKPVLSDFLKKENQALPVQIRGYLYYRCCYHLFREVFPRDKKEKNYQTNGRVTVRYAKKAIPEEEFADKLIYLIMFYFDVNLEVLRIDEAESKQMKIMKKDFLLRLISAILLQFQEGKEYEKEKLHNRIIEYYYAGVDPGEFDMLEKIINEKNLFSKEDLVWFCDRIRMEGGDEVRFGYGVQLDNDHQGRFRKSMRQLEQCMHFIEDLFQFDNLADFSEESRKVLKNWNVRYEESSTEYWKEDLFRSLFCCIRYGYSLVSFQDIWYIGDCSNEIKVVKKYVDELECFQQNYTKKAEDQHLIESSEFFKFIEFLSRLLRFMILMTRVTCEFISPFLP